MKRLNALKSGFRNVASSSTVLLYFWRQILVIDRHRRDIKWTMLLNIAIFHHV